MHRSLILVLGLVVAACGGGGSTAPTDPAVPAVAEVRRVAAGTNFSCALDTRGTAFCWGRNDRGQLGGGLASSGPQRVLGDRIFRALYAGDAHVCGLEPDGTAYCWGDNTFGQLGDGSQLSRGSVARVQTAVRFRSLALGNNHTCGVAADSLAYCWGQNDGAQVGVARGAPVLVPTRVLGGDKYQALAAGRVTTCGLRISGLLSCWGSNAVAQVGASGMLAFGLTGDAVSTGPVSRDLGPFTALAFQAFYGCVAAADGTTFCWGWNNIGQVGDGTRINRPSPVAVLTSQRFRAFSSGSGAADHVCAATSDRGEVYCWGRNDGFQLGNTGNNSPVPTLVSTAPTATELAAGAGHTCVLRTDGRVACWGSNTFGELAFTGADASERPRIVELP